MIDCVRYRFMCTATGIRKTNNTYYQTTVVLTMVPFGILSKAENNMLLWLRRLSEIFFLLIISRNRPFSRMERKIEYFNTFRILAEKIKTINPYPLSRHRSVSKNHRITQKNCEKFLLVFRYFVIFKTSLIQWFYKYFYYIGIAF